MTYACLVYQEEKYGPTVPKADIEQAKRDFQLFNRDIKQSGHYVANEMLEMSDTAKTVTVRDGKVSTKKGPFEHTKQQLDGFYVIEAEGPDEAVEIAAKIPAARWGAVEVRPIAEYKKSWDLQV